MTFHGFFYQHAYGKHTVDFVRTFINSRDSSVSPCRFHWSISAKAHTSKNLNPLIRSMLHVLGNGYFQNRAFDGVFLYTFKFCFLMGVTAGFANGDSILDIFGGTVACSFIHISVGGHVGNFCFYGSKIDDRCFELNTLIGIFRSLVDHTALCFQTSGSQFDATYI